LVGVLHDARLFGVAGLIWGTIGCRAGRRLAIVLIRRRDASLRLLLHFVGFIGDVIRVGIVGLLVVVDVLANRHLLWHC
jgi:hypothetical protein